MAMLGKKRSPVVRRERQPSRHAPAAKADDGSLTIERLAHDGRGVARNAEGKTVFVDAALPGERVDIAIHRQRKRYDEAHVRERFNAAEQRVEPPCVYAARCGGCDLQHLSVAGQREHKRQALVDLLKRQAIDSPEAIAMLAGNDAGYRRRARLGVKCDAQGQVHLGFRARGSEQLVDIDSCHVLAPPLAALPPWRFLFPQSSGNTCSAATGGAATHSKHSLWVGNYCGRPRWGGRPRRKPWPSLRESGGFRAAASCGARAQQSSGEGVGWGGGWAL